MTQEAKERNKLYRRRYSTSAKGRAAHLRRWFDVVVDHKIPVARGGTSAPKNLQIIYRSENLRKGARLDYTPSVVFI